MRKRKLFILLLGIVLAGGVAAMFLYPQTVNQGIDFVNTQKEQNSFLSRFPSLPRIPNLPFQLGLDLQGGAHLVYEANLSQINPTEYDSAMDGLRDVIERRVNLFGVKEPLVQIEGRGEKQRLIVELAGVIDTNQAISLIGQTPYLEFAEQKPNYEEIVQKNQKVLETNEGQLENPFVATALTGRFLEGAQLGFDSVTQAPLIQLQFNGEGAKLFEEITKKNVGKSLGIFLDGQPLQIPTVQEPISGGKAQITGRFTIEEARKIVRDLNAGALPVPITLISQQSVGAALGQDSLQKSLQAGIVGFFIVILFMIVIYRLSGFFASLSLAFYLLILLLIFKLIPVTFTLAGIAGVILSVGMAVDANVLIFSRMKEELREGRTFAAAIEEGFRRAWPSIRDGNITTLFVSLILFWFGSSFVQGFALALSLGILVSMFSAIVVTKSLLRLFAGTWFERFKWLWA